MLNRKGHALRKLVRPYLIYPEGDGDWDDEFELPLRDDAPIDVKEAYEKIRKIKETAAKRFVRY